MGLIQLDQNERFTGAKGIAFSGASIPMLEQLGVSEYTFCTIAVDVSLSVDSYKHDMEAVLEEIVKALRKHPRKDFLLVRILTFSVDISEIHGFLLVDSLPDTYSGVLQIQSMTALYDGTWDAISAAGTYSGLLEKSEFLTNVLTVVITDGANNAGKRTAQDIVDALDDLRQREVQHTGVLIGLGVANANLKILLENFHKEIGFDHFEGIEEIDEAAFRRVAGITHASISSVSQSLADGGSGSVSLTF